MSPTITEVIQVFYLLTFPENLRQFIGPGSFINHFLQPLEPLHIKRIEFLSLPEKMLVICKLALLILHHFRITDDSYRLVFVGCYELIYAAILLPHDKLQCIMQPFKRRLPRYDECPFYHGLDVL